MKRKLLATLIFVISLVSVSIINLLPISEIKENDVINHTVLSAIPLTKEGLGATTTYTLNTADDWIALQTLSKTTSLSGYTFMVGNDIPHNTDTWNLTNIDEFTGIGCETYPFKGILECQFDSGRAITTNCPLFACLSAEAQLRKIEVIAVDSLSGIAEILIGPGTASFSGVRVSSGTIKNTNGVAAGAFGEIKNLNELTPMNVNLDSLGLYVSVSSIEGVDAGYIAGKVTGNVSINIDSSCIGATVDSMKLVGDSGEGAVGGYFGHIDGTALKTKTSIVNISMSGNVTKMLDISGYGNVGGIIGYCKNTIVTTTENEGVNQTVEVGIDTAESTYQGKVITKSEAGNAGGFCGKAEDSSFEYIKVNNLLIKADKSSTSNMAYAGGLLGCLISNSDNSNVSQVNNIACNMCYPLSASSYAGGVIGYADNESVNEVILSDMINNYDSNADYYLNGKIAVGGIIGGLDGNGFNITDVQLTRTETLGAQTTYVNCTNSSTKDYVSIGGVIGVADCSCTITNAVVDMSASKKENGTNIKNCVGGIIGYVLNTSTSSNVISIDDVTVSGNIYLTVQSSNSMNGGVLGAIEDKAIIELKGTTDISNIDYPATEGTYNGQIAGYRGNALLYLQKDAIITKPSVNSKIMMADEVGNYGSMIRNDYYDGDDTLLITNYNVIGRVQKVNNYYQINSKGDLIRLAIALNTEGTFGLEAFDETATYSGLLSEQYMVNNNIDLTDTGIYSLTKNLDNIDSNEAGAFCGTIKGASNTVKITNSITVYQQGNLGLFAYINGATIENLSIDYSIIFNHIGSNNGNNPRKKLGNAGAVAAFAKGNVSIKNVTVTSSIQEYKYSEKEYYGGIIGEYIASTSSTISIEDAEVNVELKNENTEHYAGGLLGYYNGNNTTSNINLKSVKVGGTITSEDTTGTAYVGGLIANIVGGNGNINISAGKSTTGTYGININNLDIVTNAPSTGGLFGYTWNKVNANISDVVIGNGSSLDISGAFGGLVRTVTGRMILNRVNMNSLTVTGRTVTGISSADAKSGLLVRDGSDVFLTVNDYYIDPSNVHVSYYGDTFDEIVGFNKESSSSSNGGILSISYSDKTCLDTSSIEQYASYTNKVCTTAVNPYTRYYYDVDSILNRCEEGSRIVKTNNTWQINNADKLVIWNLASYANSSLKSYFLNAYSGFAEGSSTQNSILNANYALTSDIVLNGYSYYPINLYGGSFDGNGHNITFYGDKIKQFESATKQTGDESSQHYMMHAGLFADVVNVSSISDVGLTGNISGYKKGESYYSGALICGSLNSGKNLTINDIDIDNVWVSRQGGSEWTNPYGLLVANISSGVKVDFNTIVMKSYDLETNSGKAASALIGNVGGAEAENIEISFANMDIAELADTAVDTESSEGSKDKVLACASFIYNYSYSGDTCNGVYLFNKNDYLYGEKINTGTLPSNTKGLVTLGYELGNDEGTTTVEYNDVEELVGADDAYGTSFSNKNYKPYVYNYTSKYINVNQKTGDIVEGCGTYEDPYVITSARQLITLGRYITDKIQNASLLDGWIINKLGNDNTYCDGAHTVSQRVTYNSALSAAQQIANGFPTEDQLASAYYIIEQDIDFSTFTTFNGLGTDNIPFRGVLVGKENNGNYPVITMPVRGAESLSDECFGLIQYAKGAAVVNLNIAFENNNNISVSESGSAVYGCVKGGDNVVDNVTVTGNITGVVNGTIPNGASIGGYAGVINMGCLIIRNISEQNLASFTITCSDGSNVGAASNMCGIIGNVLDGIAIYEGNNNSSAVLMKDISNIYNNTLDASKSYDILNDDYLRTHGKIGVSYNTSGYYFNIANAAQLMMYSMALNSGAFNYDSTELPYEVGYDSKSVCRNADYSYVGSVNNTDTNSDSYKAYYDAIHNDNLNGTLNNSANVGFFKPYVYEYMNFDSSVGSIIQTGSSSTYCNLNKVNVTKERMVNIVLGESLSYNLAVYGKAFRGIGARYYTEKNLFRGVFDGNKSTVNIAINCDKSVKAAGVAFLNNISASNLGEQSEAAGNMIIIKDIKISGSIINGTMLSGTNSISDSIHQELNRDVAGVAVSVNALCKFDNVTISNLNVRAQAKAAGFVAKINESTSNCIFTNCRITSDTPTKASVEGIEDTSGFVAYINTGNVEFEGCKVENIEVKAYGNGAAINTTVSKSYNDRVAGNDPEGRGTVNGNMITAVTSALGHASMAGGFIGYSLNATSTVNITNCNYNNMNVLGYGNTGGMIGWIKSDANVPTVNITGSEGVITGNNAIIRSSCMLTLNQYISGCSGGVVGYLYSSSNNAITSVIKDVQVNNAEIYTDFSSDDNNADDATYVGGIIGGGCGNILVENCIVGDETDGNVYVGTKSTVPTIHVGGIIGGNYTGRLTNDSKVTLLKIICNNSSILGIDNNIQIVGGNTAGGFSGSLPTEIATINNFRVKGIYLTATKSSGGVIGYTAQSGNEIKINGLDILESIIYCDDSSGGIYGKNGLNIVIDNFNLENTLIYSKTYAGGIVGKAQNASKVTTGLNSDTNSIKGCTIVSKISGGIIGANTVDKDNKIMNISITDNKIIGYLGNSASNCGGLVGENNSKIYCVNLLIKNNYITSNISYNSNIYTTSNTGGLIGSQSDKAIKGESIVMENNYISFISVSEIVSNKESTYNGIYSWFSNTTYEDIKKYAYYYDTTNTNKNKYVKISNIGTITTDNIANYSFRIGAFIGTTTASANESFLLNVQYRCTTSEYEKYRPVSDVGYSSTKTYETLYDYRNKTHIIYGNYDNVDSAVNNNLIKDTVSTNQYEFASVKSIYDECKNNDISLVQKYRLDSSYTLGDASVTDTLINKTLYSDDYLSYYTDGTSQTNKILPILIFVEGDFEGGLDAAIKSYINIMTNNGGDLSSVTTGVTVNTLKASISEGQSGNAVITTSSSDMSIEYENGNFVRKKYDSCIGTCNGTFTIIKVTYSWTSGGITATQTILIPIFVEKILEINSHMRYSEGFVYSVEEMLNKGSFVVNTDTNANIMTYGSKYTLFSEYVYSAERENYQNAYIDKKLCLYLDSVNKMEIPKDTRITLVDVTDGNKAYYYTVTEDGITDIEFTSFTDTDGNNYRIKDICNTDDYPNIESYTTPSGEKVENVTRERFMIYIDQSGINIQEIIEKVKNDEIQVADTSKIYFAKISMENTEETMKKRVDYSEESFVKIKEMLGTEEVIDTSTKDDNGNTYTKTSGSISENGEMSTQVRFNITAINSLYWSEKRGTNTNQYYDLAISIQNKLGNTISIPAGTKVTYTVGVVTKSIYVYDSSFLYGFLDNGLELKLDDLNADLLGETVNVKMEFGSADLSGIETGNYSIYAELIKTQNPAYPRSGTVRDVWSGTVAGESQKELGFAVDSSELMNLGMNTYMPENSDSGEIEFATKIDFNDYLGDNATADFANLTSRHYKLSFNIYQKKYVDGNLTYVPYTGSDISVYPAGTTVFSTDNAITKHDGSENDGSITKTYTEEQISTGIVEDGFILKVDTQALDTPDGLSNYKVIVSLDVQERTIENSYTSIIQYNDYYIFTVARIKKDL